MDCMSVIMINALPLMMKKAQDLPLQVMCETGWPQVGKVGKNEKLDFQ